MSLSLSAVDVSAGTVTYPPAGALGPRVQRDVQLMLVHAGSARIWVDGTARTLVAGQVGLLLPGHRERFAFDPGGPTRHSWLQARVADVPERLRRAPPALPLSPALDAIVREAIAASPALPTLHELRSHLLGAALWRYVGEAERTRPDRRTAAEDARRFIEAQLDDPGLTLRRIAAAVHVTPAHLVRSFRLAHGTTPKAYLWERRVALAVELLEHTGLPLAVVAERCGFRTVHHFSRRVKLATGAPPGALRARRWGQST
jgi:AraC-like DNA-binding protein